MALGLHTLVDTPVPAERPADLADDPLRETRHGQPRLAVSGDPGMVQYRDGPADRRILRPVRLRRRTRPPEAGMPLAS